MGLSLFDSGRKTSTTNQTQVSNTSIGFEDVSGTAVAGSNNLIQVSDQGAISAASDIAGSALDKIDRARADSIASVVDSGRSSLEFGARITADALEVVRGSRELEGRALENALEFAHSGRELEREAYADALGFAGERSKESALAQADAFSGVKEAFASSLSFAKDLFGANVNLIGETVTGLNTIAREQSTSTDERVQDIATKGLYVAGAIAAALVLGWFMTRGRA
jgi:hypothetical protein